MTTSGNRAELATVLRRARARMDPADVGLPAGLHRRVAGLRREEVAMLAGISVDYVVRLEQGRGPHPSPSVLGALARALRLSDDERFELFHLAGSAPPTPGTIELRVRATVLRLVDRFVDLPVLVTSAKGDILAWNAMASALLGDLSAVQPQRRNMNRLRFLPDPADPPRHPVGVGPGESAAIAAQTVGCLRTAAARYPGDPALLQLLADLRTGSAEFAALWESAPAGGWRSHRKTVLHPRLGPLLLDCDTLLVPDDDQSVVVYSAAPGTPEASALSLLGVVGTELFLGLEPAHRPEDAAVVPGAGR
ncbi:helix-turn-helix transcriptional regulator [Microlunatus lacustris]